MGSSALRPVSGTFGSIAALLVPVAVLAGLATPFFGFARTALTAATLGIALTTLPQVVIDPALSVRIRSVFVASGSGGVALWAGFGWGTWSLVAGFALFGVGLTMAASHARSALLRRRASKALWDST